MIVLTLKPSPFIDAVQRNVVPIKLGSQVVVGKFAFQGSPGRYKTNDHERYCQNTYSHPFNGGKPGLIASHKIWRRSVRACCEFQQFCTLSILHRLTSEVPGIFLARNYKLGLPLSPKTMTQQN